MFVMIFIKRKYFLICAVIAAFSSGCEKNSPAEENIELPSQTIKNIMVDKNDTKWIATDKGVVSYDGTTLTKYSDNSFVNDGSATRLFLEESQTANKIWICSSNGLSTFEHNDNKISSFINYQTSTAGILSNSVLSMNIDLQSTKYIATSAGLSILSNGNWDQYFGKSGENILSKYKISAVATSKNNWVYVSTSGGGVSRFKYLDAVSGATTYTKDWASGLKSNNILTVEVVDDTCQWYGTDNGIAFHTSELTKSDWTHYSRTDGLICDTVSTIVKDLSGNIWFGTPKGISKLNNTVWTNYTTENGLVSNVVNTLAVDLDGSIWVGTDNGISHFMNNEWKGFMNKTGGL